MYSLHLSLVLCAPCLCVLCILFVYHVLATYIMFWRNVCVALICHHTNRCTVQRLNGGVGKLSVHDLQYLRWKFNFQRKQRSTHWHSTLMRWRCKRTAFIWTSAVDCGLYQHIIMWAIGKTSPIRNGSEILGGGTQTAALALTRARSSYRRWHQPRSLQLAGPLYPQTKNRIQQTLPDPRNCYRLLDKTIFSITPSMRPSGGGAFTLCTKTLLIPRSWNSLLIYKADRGVYHVAPGAAFTAATFTARDVLAILLVLRRSLG